MPDLLTLVKITPPDNDPPQPILPSGGRPVSVIVISAAWLIKKAEASDTLVFRTLDELRFTTSNTSQPNAGRFAVYLGNGENQHPVFLTLTDLAKDASGYKLDSCITKLSKKLVVPGNTLAIEIQANRGNIMVLSRMRSSAGYRGRKTAGKAQASRAR